MLVHGCNTTHSTTIKEIIIRKYTVTKNKTTKYPSKKHSRKSLDIGIGLSGQVIISNGAYLNVREFLFLSLRWITLHTIIE